MEPYSALTAIFGRGAVHSLGDHLRRRGALRPDAPPLPLLEDIHVVTLPCPPNKPVPLAATAAPSPWAEEEAFLATVTPDERQQRLVMQAVKAKLVLSHSTLLASLAEARAQEAAVRSAGLPSQARPPKPVTWTDKMRSTDVLARGYVWKTPTVASQAEDGLPAGELVSTYANAYVQYLLSRPWVDLRLVIGAKALFHLLAHPAHLLFRLLPSNSCYVQVCGHKLDDVVRALQRRPVVRLLSDSGSVAAAAAASGGGSSSNNNNSGGGGGARRKDGKQGRSVSDGATAVLEAALPGAVAEVDAVVAAAEEPAPGRPPSSFAACSSGSNNGAAAVAALPPAPQRFDALAFASPTSIGSATQRVLLPSPDATQPVGAISPPPAPPAAPLSRARARAAAWKGKRQQQKEEARMLKIVQAAAASPVAAAAATAPPPPPLVAPASVRSTAPDTQQPAPALPLLAPSSVTQPPVPQPHRASKPIKGGWALPRTSVSLPARTGGSGSGWVSPPSLTYLRSLLYCTSHSWKNRGGEQQVRSSGLPPRHILDAVTSVVGTGGSTGGAAAAASTSASSSSGSSKRGPPSANAARRLISHIFIEAPHVRDLRLYNGEAPSGQPVHGTSVALAAAASAASSSLQAEQQAAAASSDRKHHLPGLLMPLIPVFQELLSRHRTCPYQQLLHKHCPLPDSSATSCGAAAASTDTAAAEPPAKRPKLSPPASSTSLPLPTDEALLASPLALATPQPAVMAYLRDVLAHLLPALAWGSPASRRRILSAVWTWVSAGHRDRLRVDDVLCKLPLRAFDAMLGRAGLAVHPDALETARTWVLWLVLGLVTPLLRSAFYVTEVDGSTQFELAYFRKPAWWSLLLAAQRRLRATLQLRPVPLPEGALSPGRKAQLAAEAAAAAAAAPGSPARRSHSTSNNTLNNTSSSGAVAGLAARSPAASPSRLRGQSPSRPLVDAPSSRTIAAAPVRFVPKANGLRPIANLSSHKAYGAFGAARAGGGGGAVVAANEVDVVNKQLEPVHLALRRLRTLDPDTMTGSAVVNMDGVHAALLRFARLRRVTQRAGAAAAAGAPLPRPLPPPPPLHAFACDIKGAFDVIKPGKMKEMAEGVLAAGLGNSPAFVRSFCVVSPDGPPEAAAGADAAGPGGAAGRGGGRLPSNFRMRWHKLAVLEQERGLPFFDLAASFPSAPRGSVFVDALEQRSVPADTLRALLGSHLSHNVLALPDGYAYVQGQGIPQGSILSTGLCNLYFSHMERHEVWPRVAGKLAGAAAAASSSCGGCSGAAAGEGDEDDALPATLTFPSTAASSSSSSAPAPPPAPSSALLLRMVDDFLCVSDSAPLLGAVQETFSEGFPSYNVTLSTHKSQMVLHSSAGAAGGGAGSSSGGQQRRSRAAPLSDKPVTWCGLHIHPGRGDVTAANARFFGRGKLAASILYSPASSSSSFTSLFNTVRAAIRHKCHALYLDRRIQSTFAVAYNVYEVHAMAAARLLVLLRPRLRPVHGLLSSPAGLMRGLDGLAVYTRRLIRKRTVQRKRAEALAKHTPAAGARDGTEGGTAAAAAAPAAAVNVVAGVGTALALTLQPAPAVTSTATGLTQEGGGGPLGCIYPLTRAETLWLGYTAFADVLGKVQTRGGGGAAVSWTATVDTLAQRYARQAAAVRGASVSPLGISKQVISAAEAAAKGVPRHASLRYGPSRK